MVHLVTGFAGQAHVASEDDGSKQAAIIGSGRYVANIGSKFEASIKSNNLVRIADGDLFNQGRHIRIPPNSYEEVTISNGSQGVNRNDLIVMRYEKSTSNGIETANLKVIKGTAGSTAKDPEYTQGDILAGEYVDEFPLYRVKITGLSIAAVEPMFDILLPMAEMFERLNGNMNWSDAITLGSTYGIEMKYRYNKYFVEIQYGGTLPSGVGFGAGTNGYEFPSMPEEFLPGSNIRQPIFCPGNGNKLCIRIYPWATDKWSIAPGSVGLTSTPEYIAGTFIYARR